MRPNELDAPVTGRSGSRALRVTIATLSIGVIAGGLAHLATSTSSAAPVPVGDTAMGSRSNQVSRSVDLRSAQVVQTLAQTRRAALSATADELSSSREQAALTARTESMDKAAEQISRQSKLLNDQTKFLMPTAGGFDTRRFGMRLHPILHVYKMHNGDDIGGACGQPIWAAADGKVTKAATGGFNGGSGNNVRVTVGTINGKKVETAYLHMDTIAVKEGQKVHKGEALGTVGSTGMSTACHLHFSVFENGKAVAPKKYLGK